MSYCFFIAASWQDAAIPDHFKALAQCFIENGHRVVYLTDGQSIRIDKGNFQVYSFPSPRPTHLQDFMFLHKLVRQYQPDCMIANFGAVNVMTLIGWLNHVKIRANWYRTLNHQNLMDGMKPSWKSKFLRLRKRLIYRLATHMITNSTSTQEDLCNIYQITKTRCIVFYNSIADVYYNIEHLSAKSSNRIVCPGRLDYSKGQDVLIRALAELSKENINPTVDFLGSGVKLTEYQTLAHELGVEDQCNFLGTIPHHEMFERMHHATLTIIPSRSEAFGLVNIESMSVKTPVIASAVGGIPEIIRDGIDGFLVPPDDPNTLADKIKTILANEKLVQDMGLNARQRFLDMFEQKKNIETQAQWFEDLVTRSKNHH